MHQHMELLRRGRKSSIMTSRLPLTMQQHKDVVWLLVKDLNSRVGSSERQGSDITELES